MAGERKRTTVTIQKSTHSIMRLFPRENTTSLMSRLLQESSSKFGFGI